MLPSLAHLDRLPFQRWFSCHSVDPNEALQVRAYRIMGRRAAAVPGYSDAMREKGAAGLVGDADRKALWRGNNLKASRARSTDSSAAALPGSDTRRWRRTKSGRRLAGWSWITRTLPLAAGSRLGKPPGWRRQNTVNPAYFAGQQCSSQKHGGANGAVC